MGREPACCMVVYQSIDQGRVFHDTLLSFPCHGIRVSPGIVASQTWQQWDGHGFSVFLLG